MLAYSDKLIANEQVIIGQHCGDAATTIKDYYNANNNQQTNKAAY